MRLSVEFQKYSIYSAGASVSAVRRVLAAASVDAAVVNASPPKSYTPWMLPLQRPSTNPRPWLLAAQREHDAAAFAELVIALGLTKFDAVDVSRRTAAHFAVECSHSPELFDVLLRVGCSFTAKNVNGCTPFATLVDVAAECESDDSIIDAFRWFHSHSLIGELTPRLRKAIILAALHSSRTTLLHYLLEEFTDITVEACRRELRNDEFHPMMQDCIDNFVPKKKAKVNNDDDDGDEDDENDGGNNEDHATGGEDEDEDEEYNDEECRDADFARAPVELLLASRDALLIGYVRTLHACALRGGGVELCGSDWRPAPHVSSFASTTTATLRWLAAPLTDVGRGGKFGVLLWSGDEIDPRSLLTASRGGEPTLAALGLAHARRGRLFAGDVREAHEPEQNAALRDDDARKLDFDSFEYLFDELSTFVVAGESHWLSHVVPTLRTIADERDSFDVGATAIGTNRAAIVYVPSETPYLHLWTRIADGSCVAVAILGPELIGDDSAFPPLQIVAAI